MLRSRKQIPLLRRPLSSTRRALLQMRVPDSLRGPRLDAAVATLDPFSAKDVLLKACPVFRSPPPFCKAPLRKALSFALELVRDASHTPDSLECERAWKLLLFIPRMLLWRLVGVVRVPKADVLARFQAFFHGEWELLLKRAREEGAAVGHQLVPLPAHQRLRGVQNELSSWLISVNFPLPVRPSLSLWRKGAAPGPSGLTSEMLRLILDDEIASEAFADVAQVAWLLLAFGAAPRVQYALRTVPPLLTEEFAAGHDCAVLSWLAAFLTVTRCRL